MEGGPNTAEIAARTQGQGADPSTCIGSDLAGKMVNEGAAQLALGSHAQCMTIVRQSQGMKFGLGFLADLLKKFGLDPETLHQQFKEIAKASVSEVAGDVQQADIVGSTSSQEVTGSDKAPVESVDVAQFARMNLEGVEASAPPRPNVAAADQSGGLSL